MVEFIALPFPFSSKLKIWSFHVVVCAGTAKKCTKKRDKCTCRVVVLLIKGAPSTIVHCGRTLHRNLFLNTEITNVTSVFDNKIVSLFLLKRVSQPAVG